MTDHSNTEWLSPWGSVTDPRDKEVWCKELAREVSLSHVLSGHETEFVARRQDRDDFLIALIGGRYASVHLTWSVEADPRWPAASIYESFEDWRRTEMIPDHKAWEE